MKAAPMRAATSIELAVALSPSECPVCGGRPSPRCEWHGASAPTPECPCVVRCETCGHRFRAAPPAGLVIGSSYDADYHERRKTLGRSGFSLKEITFRRHLRALRKVCRVWKGQHLLDVGCATGDFLAMARGAGLTVAGVELSEYAASRAAQRRLPIVCGRIEDVSNGPYDLVHASHVLEHVPDVTSFARSVYGLLRPGGLALIEVPNEFDDLLSVLRRAAGRRPAGPFESPHLHYFGRRSLRRLFASQGLRERRFFTYSHLRPKKPGHPLGTRLRHVAAPNLLFRIADRIGRGRNLVLILTRPEGTA